MTSGGDARIIEDTRHHFLTVYIKEGKQPIAEHRIVIFLQARTPAHNVGKVLEVMVQAGFLTKQLAKGGNEYRPRGQT